LKARCVIGVGNSIAADDGVGPAVIAELRRRTLPEGVEILDAGPDPLDVIEHLEQEGGVIIVDAVRMGRAPGTVLTFPAKSAKVNIVADAFSLHGIGLAYVLGLADGMGMPAEVTIVGIEPESVEPGHAMSAAAARAVPRAADAIMNLLDTKCGAVCAARGGSTLPPAHEGEPDGEKSADH